MSTVIEQAIKGKRSAMETLYASNKQKVYFIATLLANSNSEAVDATNYAFKNIFCSRTAYKMTSEEDFTHLVIRKVVDFCKRKANKKDEKAFRVPQGKNFLVSGNGGYDVTSDTISLSLLKTLPALQRYIFVLHSIGRYLPEQVAAVFKFDMKTISIALEVEQTNIERIIRQFRQDNLSYADIIEELLVKESEIKVPVSVDEYVLKIIDNIAEPLEKKARKLLVTICASALAVIVLVVGIILITNNTDNSAELSTNDTETSDAADTNDSTLLTEPIIVLDESLTYYADIEIADYGTITVELDQSAAPVTVANFVNLAQNGFYDGLTFHRIMEGFMMQGGDPNGDGTGGNTNEDGNEINIVGEFTSNGYENALSHTRGAISMARSSEYDSASSQFFIVHSDDYVDALDGDYAVFGYVIEGLDIVDAVCETAEPTDDNGTIETDAQPVITSVTIRTESAESEQS